MPTDEVRLSVNLPTPLKKRFARTCKKYDVNMSQMIRSLIEQYIVDVKQYPVMNKAERTRSRRYESRI